MRDNNKRLVQNMESRRKEFSKSKIGGERASGREREKERHTEMQSTLASFTEQATLTHREGDYREGKAG